MSLLQMPRASHCFKLRHAQIKKIIEYFEIALLSLFFIPNIIAYF